MLRDIEDSGEIYEPKTVETSFTINCDSTFAYLFALDLRKSELIWLNIAKKSNTRVAGNTPLYFLTDYFGVTGYINVESFFAMMASGEALPFRIIYPDGIAYEFEASVIGITRADYDATSPDVIIDTVDLAISGEIKDISDDLLS